MKFKHDEVSFLQPAPIDAGTYGIKQFLKKTLPIPTILYVIHEVSFVGLNLNSSCQS